MGGRLYSSREATLEPQVPYGDEPRHSIALHPGGPASPPVRPEWVEVTGRVGSCATAHARVAAMQVAQPDRIIMVSGYCHTSNSNYVLPARVRRVARRPVLRLTEAEVPAALRPLVEVPDVRAVASGHIDAARRLAAAIATRDSGGFLNLTRPELALELRELEGAPMPDWLRRRLREVDSSFADADIASIFRGLHPAERHEQKLFVERGEIEGEHRNRSGPLQGVMVCWCRSSSCAGRWPVTTYDADNDPTRPYACIRTEHYQLGRAPGAAVQARAERRPAGFAEPEWRRTASQSPAAQ